MKLISDEQVLQWMAENDCAGFIGDYAAQAQLESCEKEHKAEITQLFEEIDGLLPIDTILNLGLEALKQKYGGG